LISLMTHGRIKTTLAKAQTLRVYAEKIITKTKNNNLSEKRRLLGCFFNKNMDLVNFSFDKIGPVIAKRNGGYLRIIKVLGITREDRCLMGIIEFVDFTEIFGERQDISQERKDVPQLKITSQV
jgi:large subunit ribosomal protein L17